MYKSFTRRLVLIVVLGALSGTIAHADAIASSPTPQTVTGGDPVPTVPTSPSIVTVILTVLQAVL